MKQTYSGKHEKRRPSPQREKRTYRPVYPAVKTALFFLTLAAGTVLAFSLHLRPSYSEEEKRELAAFASFSLGSFFDGS